MAGAHAKSGTLIIRLEVDHGQVQFFHNGKRLKDATLARLCTTAHQQKNDIQFVRAKMTRDDALTAILGEAQCLGAKDNGVSAEAPAKTKPATRTHAKHRHTKGKQP